MKPRASKATYPRTAICQDCHQPFEAAHYKSYRCADCQARTNQVARTEIAARKRRKKMADQLAMIGLHHQQPCAHCGRMFAPRAKTNVRCSLCRRQPKSRKI